MSPGRHAFRGGNYGGRSSPARQIYATWLTDAQATLAVERGELMRGHIRVYMRDGYVTVAGLKGDLYVSGERARNRAFDGDGLWSNLSAPVCEFVLFQIHLNVMLCLLFLCIT